MLMLYTAMDAYLDDGGKLGFVLPQTVFKTTGAGDGFRRFRLGNHGSSLKVLSVNDLVALQPFEGATNRTATATIKKGAQTRYPVRYMLWRKCKAGRIKADFAPDDVKERTRRIALSARPVNRTANTSPWLTVPKKTLPALEKSLGRSAYSAYAGACTWKNGVYWLQVIDERPDGMLVVENLHDVGTKPVRRVRALVEPDLVHPLLRGRDVARWRATSLPGP